MTSETEKEAMKRRIEQRILGFIFKEAPNEVKAEMTIRVADKIVKMREKREK